MLRLLALLSVFTFVTSSASAQVFYEPLRYQYGGQSTYFYGGHDQSVFRSAEQYTDGGGQFGRVHGFAWASGNVMTHREVSYQSPRVYADSMPRTNAAIYGFTADNARNEACANAPRYFRKRDLLAFAIPDEDGALHIPAQLPATSNGSVIEIKPYVRRPATGVSTGSIIIIPKHLLEQSKNRGNEVASRD